jgi:alpha-1,2-glucosyltransferase
MVPGFHALVAGLTLVAGGVSELSVRATVALLSLATIATFYQLAKALQPGRAGAVTLQFSLLPILYPQFFLVYTDVATLLFVLLLMLATVRGWLATAGLLGLVSCLMRQNNVIWVAFAMAWAHLRDYGWHWPPIAAAARRYWAFVTTGAAFVAFVLLNHGQAALGDDVGSHPLGRPYAGNIVLFLLSSCFLLLPLWWGYRRRVLAIARQRRTWVMVLGIFPLYWFGYVNDHPHNIERADFFLPNRLLIASSSTAAGKLLSFVPVAIAAVCVAAAPVRRPWWLLLPFSLLFLLPEWLVVPRYWLIPLVLFLLAREPASAAAERLQTALFAGISLVLFVIVERGWGWL